MLNALIARAKQQRASDLHLEPGLPAAIRVNGRLIVGGEPMTATALMAAAREAIGTEAWPTFLAHRSFDSSRILAGIPCRLNIFQTARGMAFAIRLLATTVPTLQQLNLHSDLATLVKARRGLVLVAGSTGSGKSTTLAALVEEVNRTRACHILTVEHPIEYHLRPKKAFIRQREVGRDTPSFERALTDALREDPDVLLVGEMRRPETMRLTLDSAETGHLVLATMHASTPAEALQRIVSAFEPSQQSAISSQLADVISAVVCQTLEYLPEEKLRVPLCEILVSTDAVRNQIRQGHFFKLNASMETGARFGMWTRERYRRWLDDKTVFQRPAETPDADDAYVTPRPAGLPPLSAATPASVAAPASADPGVIEIEDDYTDVDTLIAQLKGS